MRIKKKHLYLSILAIFILAIAFFIFSSLKPKDGSLPTPTGDYLSDDATLLMPKRESARYSLTDNGFDGPLNISKVEFESAGSVMHGYLIEPRADGEYPGVVLIPGAGVDKESELALAKTIARLGYVTLTYDVRGIGETGGEIPTLAQDYANFKSGKIAVQHLTIIDALHAADVLNTRPKVNPQKIILAGESQGGRVAMIAGAIDSRMAGVLAISSAGLHYQGMGEERRFALSLDPDNYVAKISPRPIIFIHNRYDQVISFESAAATSALALEPKYFILANDTSCNHGYCNSMLLALNASLSLISRR